ncbi:DUF4232 domain-containing protein [Actinophytocola oryzae]|uniref:Uncharacterized protein DUF4232 n=1 Tax=Actinophytocola oryzae TaxID=502181 RepID=A0A4R7V2U9_9PSEU|nr:DUF4232 domain-containing protein [Actinophytocola oryzae]TDV41776.1 uncharacterized protein DUF4232 [Actinophytocola oryzae]
MARHYRLCVIAALSLSVLSACGARQGAASESTLPRLTTTTGSGTTTTTTSSPPSQTGSESSPPNQDNPCTAESLTGSVESMDAAPGNRYVTLVLRNTGGQTCSLWGFGGLELLDVAKRPLPTDARRSLDPQPALVTLEPGDEAGKIVRWTVVATGDEPTAGPCQPKAASINVLPPDQTAPLVVEYTFGSVCDHGRLDTSAYFAR